MISSTSSRLADDNGIGSLERTELVIWGQNQPETHCSDSAFDFPLHFAAV